ncbi:MAG: hypothetical protein IPN62_15790 [Flavobacteriales bacterium]|nr:hypothetical protein [Flavobacteriales bacterium]
MVVALSVRCDEVLAALTFAGVSSVLERVAFTVDETAVEEDPLVVG